ncbi:phospholipase D-like domain-containing protein [Streptomyces sp. NPDC001315]|uniref:phospholipase D-like domain-containing protein n=1 Tax=Streptomyces sp. NPDC001315 TaxID=3364562 RepID=UPI0036C93EC0
MRARTWLAAIITVIVAALPTAAGEAVADDAPLVETGPVFNDPTGDTTAQNAILTKLGRLVQGATAGSEIRMSIYLLNSQWLVGELVKAADRGVSVQVIGDSDSVSTAYATLQNALGTDTTADSWVLTCPANSACLSQDPNPQDAYTTVNHNKFFLFSETTGSASGGTAVRDVVVQSSSNLTAWDLNTAWNDAMVVTGNTTLYQAYADYFDDLRAAGSGEIPQVADYPVETQAGVAKLYLFPRATSDPILNILNTVDDPVGDNAVCHGNSAGFGTSDGRTVIRVAMHQITRVAVAKKLWELDNAGCYVDVVYRLLDESASGAVVAQLAAPTAYGGIALHKLDEDSDGTSTHSKYLLIEGTYKGVPDQKIVFTGSHTYTVRALQGNDEALLKYADATVHDAYRLNFWHQRAAADVVQ